MIALPVSATLLTPDLTATQAFSSRVSTAVLYLGHCLAPSPPSHPLWAVGTHAPSSPDCPHHSDRADFSLSLQSGFPVTKFVFE